MKLTTTVVLALLLTVAWLVGCTDVPSTGPTPIEVNSEFRFLNAAEDLASVDMSFDLGPNVGGVAFGSANSHQTYPAGNRVGVIGSTNDTLRIAMTTDQRATVMILPMTGQFREFVKLVERRIIDPAATSTARIRGVHASPDAGDIDFTLAGADTTISGSASYRDVSSYFSVPAGDYTYSVFPAGDTTAVLEGTFSVTNMRHTAVIVGSVANGTLSIVPLQDN